MFFPIKMKWEIFVEDLLNITAAEFGTNCPFTTLVALMVSMLALIEVDG